MVRNRHFSRNSSKWLHISSALFSLFARSEMSNFINSTSIWRQSLHYMYHFLIIYFVNPLYFVVKCHIPWKTDPDIIDMVLQIFDSILHTMITTVLFCRDRASSRSELSFVMLGSNLLRKFFVFLRVCVVFFVIYFVNHLYFYELCPVFAQNVPDTIGI